MTSTSHLKARQTAKMREIVEALVAAGYDGLDSQAAALGLSRSTMWTIIKATHKSSGLSGKTLKRMLSAPGLHPLVRRKILEYIEERNDGCYGSTGNSLRRFDLRLSAASNHDRDFLVADNRPELTARQARKARTSPEQIEAAHKGMNIRDDAPRKTYTPL